MFPWKEIARDICREKPIGGMPKKPIGGMPKKHWCHASGTPPV
jgi:hypothetical protein